MGPDSSYSPLEIRICWKVLKEERIDPPIHSEYLRSGGATTLIFIVESAKAVSSIVMRSPLPANIGATRKYHIVVEIFAEANVTLHDGLEAGIVDAAGHLSNERLEEHLGATEKFDTNVMIP